VALHCHQHATSRSPHHSTFIATTIVTGLSPSRFAIVTISYIYIYIYIITIGLSFDVPYDPQPMFVIIITIIIKNWKQGKEKERLTWSCYLKTKAMVMEGLLTNVTFFPSTSVFGSLHLCSCFSLLVFSLFVFFISLAPSVFICSCSSWSLFVLSVLVHFLSMFFCIICLWFSPSLWLLSACLGFSGFVLVGWINNLRWGEVEVPFY